MPVDTSLPRFLNGRAALVTGGASGIGMAIALELARAGANVAIGSLIEEHRAAQPAGEITHTPSASALEAARSAIEDKGVSALARPLDVMSTASVHAFVGRAVEAFGHIDILVNATGTNASRPIVEESEEVWERLMQVNLSGQFRTIKACMPGMMARRWGRIINVSSTAGLEGHAHHAAYCASKAGILGLTRCVALEGAPYGISCNAICPGWVRTQGCIDYVAAEIDRGSEPNLTPDEYLSRLAASDIPIGRLMEPDEPAWLVAFLCTDRAVAITGEVIRMSGGARW